jgi:hypothetical protein
MNRRRHDRLSAALKLGRSRGGLLEMSNRVSMFIRLLLSVCMLLSMRSGYAQEPKATQSPTSAIASIYDVHEGMPKYEVLAGLASRYMLTRLFEDLSTGVELWLAQSKDPKGETAELLIDRSRVASVQLERFRSTSDDAIRLVEELESQIHALNHPPKTPSDIEKFLNMRSGVAQLETQELHYPDIDELRLFLTIGNRTFAIVVLKHTGRPSTVTLSENLK